MPVHPTQEIPAERREEFEAAARRSLQERIRYSFIKTYRPVLDDARYRSWGSTAEYRKWCEKNCRRGWVLAALKYRQIEEICVVSATTSLRASSHKIGKRIANRYLASAHFGIGGLAAIHNFRPTEAGLRRVREALS